MINHYLVVFKQHDPVSYERFKVIPSLKSNSACSYYDVVRSKPGNSAADMSYWISPVQKSRVHSRLICRTSHRLGMRSTLRGVRIPRNATKIYAGSLSGPRVVLVLWFSLIKNLKTAKPLLRRPRGSSALAAAAPRRYRPCWGSALAICFNIEVLHIRKQGHMKYVPKQEAHQINVLSSE